MNITDLIEASPPDMMNGNFGAMMFMVTYIGFFGFNLIAYFSYQFITESSSQQGDEIPSGFFTILNQINEQEKIYSRPSNQKITAVGQNLVFRLFCYLGQLANREWIRHIYQVYFDTESSCEEFIEEKVEHCSKKYCKKIERLRSKQVYYVENSSNSV